jgi:hypothetical protein
MGLAAEGHPSDKITATMTHWLLARQMPDGSWLGNGLNRPPSEYSAISHTAIATGGLKAYPLPGRKNEIAASLQRARQWLVAAEPKSAEERGMRLMGLVWTVPAAACGCDQGIRDRPEAGGGWSQFARTDPDAYATGLSLYALHRASPTDDTRKGIAFCSQSVSGRSLAREDALLSRTGTQRISFRAASMDPTPGRAGLSLYARHDAMTSAPHRRDIRKGNVPARQTVSGRSLARERRTDLSPCSGINGFPFERSNINGFSDGRNDAGSVSWPSRF